MRSVPTCAPRSPGLAAPRLPSPPSRASGTGSASYPRYVTELSAGRTVAFDGVDERLGVFHHRFVLEPVVTSTGSCAPPPATSPPTAAGAGVTHPGSLHAQPRPPGAQGRGARRPACVVHKGRRCGPTARRAGRPSATQGGETRWMWPSSTRACSAHPAGRRRWHPGCGS
jgi:hypothetical protein